jgi:hypothetical protein
MKRFSVCISLALLTACASTPPQNTANVCSMFDERRSWYKAAMKSEKRWDVPMHVSMAFIEQESSFNAGAKPPRKKYFGFIPGRRPSSAYGYAQVLDGTWTEYKEAAGNWGARRNDFGDAVDFVGWYNNNSYQRNGIQRDDAYNLYLAYHEGNGGYRQGSYRSKAWLMDVAQTVQSNADTYHAQFQQCENKLGRNWFMRLFS